MNRGAWLGAGARTDEGQGRTWAMVPWWSRGWAQGLGGGLVAWAGLGWGVWPRLGGVPRWGHGLGLQGGPWGGGASRERAWSTARRRGLEPDKAQWQRPWGGSGSREGGVTARPPGHLLSLPDSLGVARQALAPLLRGAMAALTPTASTRFPQLPPPAPAPPQLRTSVPTFTHLAHIPRRCPGPPHTPLHITRVLLGPWCPLESLTSP